MSFICVLSVNGTLASYRITPENENTYGAVLRNSGQRQEELPAQISLLKTQAGWVGEPHHSVIVPALVNAIEAGQ